MGEWGRGEGSDMKGGGRGETKRGGRGDKLERGGVRDMEGSCIVGGGG